MKINHFEELECWILARELTKVIYRMTKKPTFGRDFSLVDQIRRSAASVMTNIAEGFERGTNKDFAKFLFISRGSAGETRSLLYVALDQGYISKEEFDSTKALCVRCSQIIYGLINHLMKHSSWRKGEQL